MASHEQKIALVTGGSRGIGAAIAVDLARAGFDIWLNYREGHDSAVGVGREVREAGAECVLLPFDVSDKASVEHSLEPLLETKTPYAVINNAGVSRDALMAWMTFEEWQRVISVTLDGFFLVTGCVLGAMMRKRRGRIVNIVSTAGQRGLPGQVNYSAAKAGLAGATRALSSEVAQRNIQVNAVSPGFIDTDMTADIPREQVLQMIPMGRFGTVEEVSGIVTFLCSERASYITGQTISVNGGITM